MKPTTDITVADQDTVTDLLTAALRVYGVEPDTTPGRDALTQLLTDIVEAVESAASFYERLGD